MGRWLLFLTLFCGTAAQAFEVESYLGANSTTFDSSPDADSWGISARAKFNFYSNNRGMFINVNARGISLFTADLLFGYAWRTSGSWFFEAGGGLAYGTIFGPGIGAIVGTGYRITSNIFISFPLIMRLGGATFFFWSPYVGMEF